ncbi:MAG: HD-GYP domain-containing protein [Planctomycetota bacterium]
MTAHWINFDVEPLRALRLVCWRVSGGRAAHIDDSEHGLHAWAMLPEVLRSVEDLSGQHHDGEGRRWGMIGGGLSAVSVGHGELVLAALPEGFERSDRFLMQCRAASLSADRIAGEVGEWSVHPGRGAERALKGGAWGVDSQRLVADCRRAMAGYTRELTTCYETLDFVYKQSRSMERVAEPESVLTSMCQGLCAPVELSWAAMWVREQPGLPPSLSGHVFRAGDCAAGDAEMSGVLSGMLSRSEELVRTRVVAWSGKSIGPDVVARCVSLDGATRGVSEIGAVIVAGTSGSARLSSYEIQLVEASAGHARAYLEIQRLWYAEQSYVTHTLESLTRAIDAKDPYTSGHSERVAQLSKALTLVAGLGEELAERAYIAGLVHDIGKIGVSETVLRKPGRLTGEEFDEIKKHPEIGARILERLTMLDDVRPAVLSHHERWDGRGYPNGLSGESIDLLARIVGISDTFDAMSSNRAYRSALPREKVLAEIAACAGKQFDPELAESFGRLDLSAYDAILKQHAGGRRAANRAAA